MPARRDNVGSPAEWLRIAKADLIMAEKAPEFEHREEMASYHTQQAVEKALKSVLVLKRIDVPYTHNIAKLLSILQRNQVDFPPRLRKAARLTEYVSTSRYPGAWEKVSKGDFEEAVRLAKIAIDFAETAIQQSSFVVDGDTD